MKLCDRCPLAVKCWLDHLGPACRHARAENAPWLEPDNAEVLSNMDERDMGFALFGIRHALWRTPDDVINWLLSPAKSESKLSDWGGET